MRGVFAASASLCILVVVLICAFLFVNGLPFFTKYNPIDFLSGTKWKPLNEVFGILPMILGSLYITLGAVLIGAPIGILTAICMSYFASARVVRFAKPLISLLAGIPSIVYGFFGLMFLVPLARELFGGAGNSILVASVLLAIMILPTIIQTSEAAMLAVPRSYYEGSLAMGASHEESVFKAMVPAAKPGILSGLVLGIGRAVGETTAVIMVAGNQARMPKGIFEGARTLTVNVLMEMGYAADLHYDALIATGVVLFILILFINSLFSFINKRRVAQ